MGWLRRLGNTVASSRMEDSLDEEVRFHIEERTNEYVRAGMTPESAKREALRRFGNVPLAKERVRDADKVRWLEDLARDTQYAFRMLRKNPGFAAVAILTLALGIGANAAIFSIVNAVLVRPLPFADPERLVRLYGANPRTPSALEGLAPATFRILAQESQTLAAVGGYQMMADGFAFVDGDRATQAYGARVTAGFFTVFGVPAFMGRTFEPGDDAPGTTPKAVVSFAFWQRELRRDPDIVGRIIRLDGRDVPVVGVMPPGFWFPRGDFASIWISAPGGWAYEVVGRLRADATPAQAQADLDRIAADVQRTSSTPWTIVTRPLKQVLVGDVQPVLWLLWAATAIVLVIACVNVMNLMLARATTRDRELAIRTAIGASRGRVVRQLLTESVVLAGIGAGGGVLLGYWSVNAVIALIPRDLQVLRDVPVTADARVLATTAAIALVSAGLCGIGPALLASKSQPARVMNEAGRSTMDTPGRRRARGLLVIAEFALSVMLLVGAGLVTRTLMRLQNVDPGIRPERVLTATIALPPVRYTGPEATAGFYERLLDKVRTLPGVESASISFGLPPDRVLSGTSVHPQGRPPGADEAQTVGELITVDGRYFETLGIPLVAGRSFDSRDTLSSMPVTIVNETLARRFFGSSDPIGRTLVVAGGQTTTLIGVVKDVKYAGLDATGELTLYQAFAQNPTRYMSMAVRTSDDGLGVAAAIHEQVARLDREAAFGRVRLMNDLLFESVGRARFRTTLLLAFAGLALVLATIGIYGVMTYSVSQRTREMGVRLALGARANGLLRLVLGEGLILAVIGITLGIVGALALTHTMSRLLFGVTPTDPITFLAVALVFTAVALIACWLPARRATRVDPLVALRSE